MFCWNSLIMFYVKAFSQQLNGISVYGLYHQPSAACITSTRNFSKIRAALKFPYFIIIFSSVVSLEWALCLCSGSICKHNAQAHWTCAITRPLFLVYFVFSLSCSFLIANNVKYANYLLFNKKILCSIEQVYIIYPLPSELYHWLALLLLTIRSTSLSLSISLSLSVSLSLSSPGECRCL